MSYSQKEFRSSLTHFAEQKKEARTKNDPSLWTEKDEKEFEAFKVHYKYYYEGGDFPTINAPWRSLEVFPQYSKPINDWVGCKNCDWERRLANDEYANSPPWCPNALSGESSRTPDEHYKAEGTWCYPSNERKKRGSSWLDTLETIIDKKIDEEERKKQEQEKRELERSIKELQGFLKMARKLKQEGHPQYGEHEVNQLEQQLAEAKAKYENKFGELPSSLREDVGGGGVKTPPKMERVMCCG